MKLRRSEYTQGRGAVYAKHILRGDVTALRLARWEVATLLRALLSAEERAGAGAALWALAVGAFNFVVRGLRRSAPPQG
jgi:hypothetical protein